jgi:hypothetical protein
MSIKLISIILFNKIHSFGKIKKIMMIYQQKISLILIKYSYHVKTLVYHLIHLFLKYKLILCIDNRM